MISIVIIGVLVTVVAPGMASFFDTQRLKAAAEELYGDIQTARSEAIARKVPVHLNFSVDAGDATIWTYGVSNISGCDLTITAPTATNDACTLVVDDGDLVVHGIDSDGDGVLDVDVADRVLQLRSSVDHSDIALNIAGITSGTQITFEPVNGTAVGTNGNLQLTSPDGKLAQVRVSPIGQVRLCSPDDSVVGYLACP